MNTVKRFLLRTSERCPECDAIIYMKIYPTLIPEGDVVIIETDNDEDLFIADGVYLDRDGVCCITQYDENTRQPDYYCLLCRWVA
tara:strand:- start:1437 stop:1691 length:255 start_codon:yes stop_codon:yes gene_type:complete